ncbi:MAG: phage holin family protein [Propionibacterium sp.]|nr:phage holin family protein [Propionibacterium sp.]MDN6794128.1 phage holin family protein [Propionibacterium sp.]
MPRFLLRVLVTLASAAIGLGVAALLVDGFQVKIGAFIFAVITLTVVQALLAPLITRVVGTHAPALEGGVGILSTLAALLVVSLVPGGVTANRISTWLFAAIIVWFFTGASAALFAHLQRRREVGKD